MSMKTVLSEEQLRRYEREGILFPIRVLSTTEASSYRGEIETIIRTFPPGSVKRLDSLHLFFDWAHRLVNHDALLDAIEDILGPDLLVDGTLVFYKPPQDSSYVSWHQDSVYSGWHLTPSVSAWIALTACDSGIA
jgi:non-heme Fe2+,alpha-ketoglutarate-dependent halogenase